MLANLAGCIKYYLALRRAAFESQLIAISAEHFGYRMLLHIGAHEFLDDSYGHPVLRFASCLESFFEVCIELQV